jgi:hypothetical protein
LTLAKTLENGEPVVAREGVQRSRALCEERVGGYKDDDGDEGCEDAGASHGTS